MTIKYDRGPPPRELVRAIRRARATDAGDRGELFEDRIQEDIADAVAAILVDAMARLL